MQNNIRKLRQAKKLTMKELAEKVGTSQQQVDRLEKSRRRLTAEWMDKFSKALSCTPLELVNFSNENKKPAKTVSATVIGAIETRFSNSVREFDEDEQYEISFKPAKNDNNKKFFALVVEGGRYKNYPENSELVFAEEKTAPAEEKKTSWGLAEAVKGYISGKADNIHKFTIGKKTVEGTLVKSIRSE